MLRFSANLTMLFNEHPFLDRFAAAAQAGFKAVEYVGAYAYPKEQIADLLHHLRLEQALFNLPAGNWDAGERGIACLPDRIGEFQESVGTALDYAKATQCTRLNCLAGIVQSGLTRQRAWDTMCGNLRFAAKAFRAASVQLVIEPINRYDMPGFLLNTSTDGIRMIEDTGEPDIKLQYDVYHMQRMEGELAATMKQLMPCIGHIQIADNPGRHEPGTGEINYDFLLRYIESLGYDGWIGCEYRPKAGTKEGLGWLKQWA